MEENNKIIAEFMGYALNENDEYPIEYITVQGHWDTCSIQDLNYHKSWDWLMKVVEKITSILMLDDNYKYNYLYIGYDFEDKEHYVNLYVSEDTQLNGSSKNSKIEATYEAVVKFINFYNKQKEE